MNHLKSSAHQLYLRLDGSAAVRLPVKVEDAATSDVLDPIALLDAALLLENRSLEQLSFLDQDFFLAFAKQMQVDFHLAAQLERSPWFFHAQSDDLDSRGL